MKRFHVWALIFTGLVVILTGSSADAAQQAYKCGRDASGNLVCQRITSVARSGQSGTYNDTSSGKMCKWKCQTDQQGIETCKASWNECSKKPPPHWR